MADQIINWEDIPYIDSAELVDDDEILVRDVSRVGLDQLRRARTSQIRGQMIRAVTYVVGEDYGTAVAGVNLTATVIIAVTSPSALGQRAASMESFGDIRAGGEAIFDDYADANQHLEVRRLGNDLQFRRTRGAAARSVRVVVLG